MCTWTKICVVSSECKDLEAASTSVLQMLLLLLNCDMDQEEQRPKDTGNDGKLKGTIVKYGVFFNLAGCPFPSHILLLPFGHQRPNS